MVSHSSKFLSLRPSPVAGAMLAAVLMPGAALAADLDADSPTIVVNGRQAVDANPNANPDAPYKVERSSDSKYTEPLRDTPKTITIIPKEVIEDKGALSLRDVVRTQPGVTLGTGEGGNAYGDRIFIRGFEARNDVYIDGMRDPGVTSREIFALEQIEVVKGPSSAFGGRGTTGGSVSLQSKKPQAHDFTVIEANAGSDNLRRGTIDLNRKLSDTLSVRVNGLYHYADTPGRDHVHQERYGFAAAILFEPIDTLAISADYYRARMDGIPDYGHPFDVDTQQPIKVDRSNFYGVIGRDFLKNGADVGSLTVRFSPMDSLTLRSQTRYGETFNRYVVSVPRAPTRTGAIDAWTVSVGAPQRNSDNRYWAHISDATFRFGAMGINHTLVAGFEYAHEEVSAKRWAFPAVVEDANGNIISAPGAFVRNLLNPDAVLGYTIPAVLDTTPATITKIDTASVYLLDTIKFSPKLEAVVGIRYDDYAVKLSRAAGIGSNGAAVTSQYLASKAEFFNYQASLVYKPIEVVSLYGSFSTSSNPSGEQVDGSGATYNGLAENTKNLEPERNISYELGAKLELADGKLLLSSALFQITKKNAREQVAPGVFDTVGQLRARGVEFGASGNITRRLAVFGGLTWLDAKVRKATVKANEGARFPNVPEYSLSLLTTYALTNKLTIGGQAYYQDEVHGGLNVAGASTIPGYWRFDAVARYQLAKAAELRLNVLNLTDKTYYEAIYTSNTPFSFVAPGRSASLALTLNF